MEIFTLYRISELIEDIDDAQEIKELIKYFIFEENFKY